MAVEKIKGFKIRLRKIEILKYLGYNSRVENINQNIENLIQRQIEEAYQLISPAVLFESFSKDSKKGRLIIKDFLKSSSRVMKLVDNSCAFTLMTVTIGKYLEKEVEELKKKDLTKASILDAAGSEAAEQSANFVTSIIGNRAEEDNCTLSMRFSPGYGDWPVAASAGILEFLNGGKIGISVSESGIMKPRKSVTAMQAWIPG